MERPVEAGEARGQMARCGGLDVRALSLFAVLLLVSATALRSS